MRYQTISTDFFAANGVIYYVTIAMLLFSCVEMTCHFNVWGYHVFVQKLTWYFIGEYTMILQQFFMHMFYRDLYS